MSREAMEKFISAGTLSRFAVVSFCDPISPEDSYDNKSINYQSICKRYYQIPLEDLDYDELSDYAISFDEYFTEAKELATFIDSAIADGYEIICQCEYGQSRSAGCAAAIQEFYYHNGIEIFSDYRYFPNKMIYHKLLDALKKKSLQ